jgi:membrane fusion protein (multidrug efflux system)
MMSSKAKKIWWIVGALAVLAALALPKVGSLLGNSSSNKNNHVAGTPQDPRMPVRIQIVQTEKLGDRILTVGTILSNEEVDIRSEISGKVEKIYFKEGATVRKGELLLKINDAEPRAQQVRGQYRQALAEQDAERQRQLFEKRLASQEEYDIAVNQLNIVKADIVIIQAQIAKTEIRAPFDGTVGLRYVSEGSYISPATRITTLQDYDPVKVDFTIPEKYAAQVKKGDKIAFSVEGVQRKFEGSVYALEAKIDPATRTLHMRGLSPNPDGALIPGAFANVEIVFKEKEKLTIPSFALIPELKGQKVFLYKNGKAASQSVEIGTRTDELVEVTHGVQSGDTLITSGILQLRPGMAVRLADAP